MKRLSSRHSSAGVKRRFLDKVALPSWWADSIAATQGGLREAAGDICAHLVYSLGSLLDEKQLLTFAHTGSVKYKKTKAIDVKVVVQFDMRFDHAARLAIGSRERWETGLRVVDWTGDQLRVLRPFQRSGWRALAAR